MVSREGAVAGSEGWNGRVLGCVCTQILTYFLFMLPKSPGLERNKHLVLNGV